jgi:NAD-dependent SIR2 family protein deacetylase
MVWIVKTRAYLNLFKEEYSQIYDYKYNRIHKLPQKVTAKSTNKIYTQEKAKS